MSKRNGVLCSRGIELSFVSMNTKWVRGRFGRQKTSKCNEIPLAKDLKSPFVRFVLFTHNFGANDNYYCSH